MTSTTWRARLRGEVIAAPLVPRDATGAVSPLAHEAYVRSLVAAGQRSFAVWAHTARGASLSHEERVEVLRTVRALTDGIVVATVGAPEAAAREGWSMGHALDEVRRQAETAAALGSDLLMVFPPSPRIAPGLDETLAIHQAAADASGLALLAFVLYEGGGGRPDSASQFPVLLAQPEIVGVKIATLDSPVTFQDLLAQARATQPDKVVLSGEDRFYGASLMWGADAGLVGIAAVRPELTLAVNRAWFGANADEFVAASARLDAFAAATFRQPIDNYVSRLLAVAVRDGVIDAADAFDLEGRALTSAELHSLGRALLDWE